MTEVNGVIFDASGTLIDDLFPVWQTNLKIFAHMGIPSMTLNDFKERFTLPYWKFYRSLGIQENKAKNEANTLFKRFYAELSGIVKLFPEVKSTIDDLKRISMKLAIVSSMPKDYLILHLKKFNIYTYFDVIISSEDCDESKPSPKPILICVSRLGLNHSHVVYVGDMEEDIIAGKKADVKTVAVSREGSYHQRKKLEKRNPDFMIDDLRELLRVIKQIDLQR